MAVIENYPGNSYKEREDRKKQEQIAKGKIMKRKRSAAERLADSFLEEDRNSVLDYIIYDVVIPAIKSTITDVVSGGVERLLYGESRRPTNVVRNNGTSYVPYSSYSSYKNEPVKPDVNRFKTHRLLDNIIFGQREEAEEVLSAMIDICEQYGSVSVADMYDLIGVTSDYTDAKFGWMNLGSASVKRVREGYLLSLPRAIAIY